MKRALDSRPGIPLNIARFLMSRGEMFKNGVVFLPIKIIRGVRPNNPVPARMIRSGP